MKVSKLLIDADILAYRVGYKSEGDTLTNAIATMEESIANILNVYPETPYRLYLSGKGADNYRHKYATTAPYKGNRKDKPKPVHLKALRDYLIGSLHDVVVSTDNEADDLIAIDYTTLWNEYVEDPEGVPPCVVSVDKDFDQLTGLRYDPVKGEEVWKDKEEATLNLWCQCLTGDRVDNIKGVYGIGPKKSIKLLEKCRTDYDCYNVCVSTYVEKEGLTLDEGLDRVRENMILLYLQRKPDDIWGPDTHLDGSLVWL